MKKLMSFLFGSLISLGGFSQIASPGVGDVVWHDVNANGTQNTGEDGIEGVTVNLYNNMGVFLLSTVSNALGEYGFYNLALGEYRLEFILPPGASFSSKDMGWDVTDSDVNPSSGFTDIFVIQANQFLQDIDAGIILAPNNQQTPSETPHFQLFPNPAQSSVEIQLNYAAPTTVVSLISLDGKVLMQEKIKNETVTKFSVANLCRGMYFIRVETENKATYHQKLWLN